MTVIEVQRYIDGYMWRTKQQMALDYSLANLIGLSVGRMTGSTFPSIFEAYPEFFKDERDEVEEEEKIATNSINNFMAFAMAHNKKMKGVESKE